MTEYETPTLRGESGSDERQDHIALLLRLAGPRLQAPSEDEAL